MEIYKEDQSFAVVEHANVNWVELNPSNFEKEVLKSNDSWVVYFTALGQDQPISKEYKFFKKLVRQFMGPVKIGVFRIGNVQQG